MIVFVKLSGDISVPVFIRGIIFQTLNNYTGISSTPIALPFFIACLASYLVFLDKDEEVMNRWMDCMEKLTW